MEQIVNLYHNSDGDNRDMLDLQYTSQVTDGLHELVYKGHTVIFADF